MEPQIRLESLRDETRQGGGHGERLTEGDGGGDVNVVVEGEKMAER